MIKRKIFKMRRSAVITLPLKVIELFGFRIGDEVELQIKQNQITIKKIESHPEKKKPRIEED